METLAWGIVLGLPVGGLIGAFIGSCLVKEECDVRVKKMQDVVDGFVAERRRERVK